jgi:hypothetical protein
LLASLTCRLIVAPATAWREIAAGDAELRLPNPVLLPAAVGGLSVVLSAAASALRPEADFSSVVRMTLAAIGGWVGAGAAAVSLAPSLISADPALAHSTQSAGAADDRSRALRPIDRSDLVRYASLTSLPLAAGGLFSLLPPRLPLNLAISAGLGLLAFRSGSLGARTLLGLRGPAQRRAAIVTALVSTLPALLAALSCAAR